MKEVPFTDIQVDLSQYLQLAKQETVVITCDGKHVAVLTGLQSEEDWQDFQLENDERFLQRILYDIEINDLAMAEKRIDAHLSVLEIAKSQLTRQTPSVFLVFARF